MTRAEKVAEAQRLRAEGLLLREIAERMGCGFRTVSVWLNDPDGSKSRRTARDWRALRAGVCVDCGGHTSPNAEERCRACWKVHRAADEWRGYRRMVEGMWAEGMTGRQIDAALGLKGLNISALRARGYNLPHRRTPEQIARIVTGTDDRLAKARAARKAAP